MPDSTEEELNLDGAGPAKPSSTTSAADDHISHMDAPVPDLSGITTPGQTNEEFVNSILSPETNLITWEDCWLPSQGLYYGWPDGLIQVRAMGQTAEKILATQRLAQTGQSLDRLFRECARFPQGFDPLDLLLGDRVFLLYFIRGITHGNMYEFAFTCPNQNCEHISTHQYDLNDLAQTIVWADKALGTEPFKVVLPWISQATKREVWVGVRFLRAADGNDMLAKRKARKKLLARPGVRTRVGHNIPGAVDPRVQADENRALDDTISQSMEKIVVNVMGVGNLFTVRAFLEKMHAQDTAAIREWLREHTPGIDNTVAVTCPECETEFTVELPISESFFRPTKSRRA